MIDFLKLYAGKQVCFTCAYYYQHYRSNSGKGFSPVCCGHCTMARAKTRKPDQTCEHWKEKEKQKNRP